VHQACLAEARRRGHEDHARAGLLLARREGRREGRQLRVATDACRRLAQQRPHGSDRLVLADQGSPLAVALHAEARVEQRRGRGVELHAPANARGPRGDERLRGAIDDLADAALAAHQDAARGHDEGRVRSHGGEGQRASRGALRLFRRRHRAGDRHDPGAPRECVDHPAPLADRSTDGVGRVRRPALAHRLVLGSRRGGAEDDARDAQLVRGDGRRHPDRQGPARLAERAQLVGERGGVGGAVLGLLREQPGHEGLELTGYVVANAAQRGGGLEEHLREDGELTAAERRVSGETAEHDRAERVDVGARVDRPPAHLLGRHVRGRPDEHAGGGDLGGHGSARDAEVEQLDGVEPVADEEQVRGLQVAVDDAAGVRGCERVGDAARDRERLGDAEGPVIAEALRQVPAVQPLHRQVARAVGHHAVVEVPHDALVVDRRQDDRLPGEALDVRVGGRDELDGDRRARRAVTRAIDVPHPACARERDELEPAGDGRPDEILRAARPRRESRHDAAQ